MTVKELIKNLLDFPGDMPVNLIINNSGEELETTIEFDKLNVHIQNGSSVCISNVDLRAYNVRRKLDQMKRGNICIAWTGMRLTMEEYKEGVSILENHPDRERAVECLNIFRMRRPAQ